MYRDFGVGQMGDMGAHTMDLVWNVVDCGAPSAIDVDFEASDKYDPNICPVKLKVNFEHPANKWRGPINLVWYQGGLKPNAPRGYIDLSRVGNGAIFEGTKGSIFCDFTTRVILPNNDDGDFTYYKRRSSGELLPLVGGTGQPTQMAAGRAGGGQRQGGPGGPGGRGPGAPGGRQMPQGFTGMPSAEVKENGFPAIQMMEGNIPAAIGMPNTDIDRILEAEKAGRQLGGGDVFQKEWIDACKGLNGSAVHGMSAKTHCDFDYSGTMIEQMLLGLVAHRAGKRLEYDGATGRVTNMNEANDYLKRDYRPNWKLDG
jgi:hypothetical protein